MTYVVQPSNYPIIKYIPFKTIQLLNEEHNTIVQQSKWIQVAST